MAKALVGSAELGGKARKCSAMLLGEIRALANEIVGSLVVVEGLFLPRQAVKVLLLKLR